MYLAIKSFLLNDCRDETHTTSCSLKQTIYQLNFIHHESFYDNYFQLPKLIYFRCHFIALYNFVSLMKQDCDTSVNELKINLDLYKAPASTYLGCTQMKWIHSATPGLQLTAGKRQVDGGRNPSTESGSQIKPEYILGTLTFYLK